jgi:hypothetical protein
MAAEDDLPQPNSDLAVSELALADAALAAPDAGQIPDPAPVADQAPDKTQEAEARATQADAMPESTPNISAAGVLRELMDERDKRQALERQLNEYLVRQKPADAPDPFLNPEQFAQTQIQTAIAPIDQRLTVALARINFAEARAVHGAELAEKAYQEFDKAMPEMTPAERATVMGAPNPFVAAVAWMRRRDALVEVGDDVGAYRERLREELLKDPEFLGRAIEAARSTAAGGNSAASQPRTQAGQFASPTAKPASLPSVNRAGADTNAALVRHDPSDMELVDEVLTGREISTR